MGVPRHKCLTVKKQATPYSFLAVCLFVNEFYELLWILPLTFHPSILLMYCHDRQFTGQPCLFQLSLQSTTAVCRNGKYTCPDYVKWHQQQHQVTYGYLLWPDSRRVIQPCAMLGNLSALDIVAELIERILENFVLN